MSTVVVTSVQTIAPDGAPLAAVVTGLKKLAGSGTAIGVISNHSEPTWWAAEFGSIANIDFVKEIGRQDGKVIINAATQSGIAAHNFVVLGGSMDDLEMAKNAGAVFVPAKWASDDKTASYGIAVADMDEFLKTVDLIDEWPGTWFWTSTGNTPRVRVLANASGKGGGVTADQAAFSSQLRDTVKHGGAKLTALMVVIARSLLASGALLPTDKLLFGVYPSSKSANDDTEVLSDFTHRLRTTVSRVTGAKRGQPLFIRHKPSAKRSSGSYGGNRKDPTEQLQTLRLNLAYTSTIKGRHVIVFDDNTTHGVSFGVAYALLKKAGAAAVTCVAIGKFGDQLSEYDIQVTGDPFNPLGPSDYTGLPKSWGPSSLSGTTDPTSQGTLIKLLLS